MDDLQIYETSADEEIRASAKEIHKARKAVVGEAIAALVESQLPKNYFVTESGIFYQGEKDPYFVCSMMLIQASTCDRDGQGWGRRLIFDDVQGKRHDIVIPMSLLSGDGSELRSKLMDCGLIISHTAEGRRRFLQLLATMSPASHVECVYRTGWHGNAFVLPDVVISGTDDTVDLLLQNVDRATSKFNVSGSLEDWQANIAKYCRGNPKLMFPVCLAFAAPLLSLAGEPSGGFHLFGSSSTGKTTALYVAGSVWGGDDHRGFIESWRTTANGLEATAEAHSHCLLLLDEISQVEPKEVGSTVYSLANGFGKARMTKQLAARPRPKWDLLFLSSGEKTLEHISAAAGQRVHGGQDARLVNISADAGRGLGIFEELHEFESAGDFSKHLAAASKKFYGAAIRQFIKGVCDNREEIVTKIQTIRQWFQNEQKITEKSGEVGRVASRIALAITAGLVAIKLGIVDWSEDEVVKCGEDVLDGWVALRGTSGNFDVQDGVRRVLAFIAKNGSSRFQPIEPRRDGWGNETFANVHNRAGFTRTNALGVTEYLILPETFDKEICNGIAHTAVARELASMGLLKKGPESTSLQVRVTLPGLGRTRVYVVVPGDEADES